jgi:uncharacterized protein YcbK (DUF882 family)
MKLTKNFTKKELECKHCGKCEMEPEFLILLQKLRDKMGVLFITSGFRCLEHNTNINGAKNSQHLLGKAVDIDTSTMPPDFRYKLIQTAMEVGFKGIGVAKTFIHIDNRINPAIWVY